ncbi:MAG: arylsulfatase [Verrucomicrobiaceae bacterium]|jgi:arylsulfatase A|nr:arylsulfatase [Verrucomicrobiaceae bacterium]
MTTTRLLSLAAGATLVLCNSPAIAGKSPDSRPNVVIIMTDDQGYADTGKFGATGFKTPHLDQMAEEGLRFTNWYVPQAVCGASRAGLLTGCYPNRINMLGAPGPSSRTGIAEGEMLISEMLKECGYATALFGKWHLGHHEKFLPLQHGFDEYYGLPYSNDMWPHHPGVRHLPLEKRLERWPHLPMIEDNKIINKQVTPEDQVSLTTSYTEKAVDFIARNKARPFFLYVAHSMPHVPLYVSEKFKGKSEQGLYGDVIMEIDWSVGEILSSLRKHGIDRNTMVLFTSDNGPWLSYGNHAGSAHPLREGKGTTWEGGQRVPCIVRWPRKITAGTTCHVPAMHIDLFPTIRGFVNGKGPSHRVDGKDISSLLTNPSEAKSPHEAYFFYRGDQLEAVRSGKWSLHLNHSYRSLRDQPGKDGIPGPYRQKKTEVALFDLEADIGQERNIANENRQVVNHLQGLAKKFDADLKASKREKGSL